MFGLGLSVFWLSDTAWHRIHQCQRPKLNVASFGETVKYRHDMHHQLLDACSLLKRPTDIKHPSHPMTHSLVIFFINIPLFVEADTLDQPLNLEYEVAGELKTSHTCRSSAKKVGAHGQPCSIVKGQPSVCCNFGCPNNGLAASAQNF